MSGASIIELAGVDVVHEETRTVLVRDVNWQIAPGDCWVIGGGAASGKSSLLATAAGLQTPADGTLRILGRTLEESNEQEQIAWRRSIGFVFENGGRLLHNLTVAENVALPLRYHLGQDPDQIETRVEELLERAELLPYAHAMPSRLGLGLRQRASLVRALAVPTHVLFLDNPFGGLAPREARWWLEFLAELKAQPTAAGQPLTLVASCADFSDWTELATQFGVIEAGNFRVLGGREQLLASEEEFVRELL